MTKNQKLTTFIIVLIAAIAGVIALFRYNNPGLYFKYKCNEGGDSSRKFYDPNWQARGAVCDGYWIPFTSSLNGKDAKQVLAKMAQFPLPTTTTDMKKLAESSAKLI